MGGAIRCYRNVDISVRKNSHIGIGSKVKINSNVVIAALNGGSVNIGDGSSIGGGSIIASHNSIKIGSNTMLAPGVLVYDHDHQYSSDRIEFTKYKTAPIEIGNNCWIGANSIILRGTIIGDNSIIGAGCVVKGVVPSGCILIQKRDNIIRKIE